MMEVYSRPDTIQINNQGEGAAVGRKSQMNGETTINIMVEIRLSMKEKFL